MFLLKRALSLSCLLALMVSGCNLLGSPRTPQNLPAPTIPEKVSKELQNLFPQRIRTQWKYQGTGSYIQSMVLQKKAYNNGQDRLVQRIVGNVGPASGGKTLPLILEYIFTSQEIRERIISSSLPFPQKIPDLILIKLPLRVGNTWSQQIRLLGEVRRLQATITGVEQMRNGITKFTVHYRVPMKEMPGGVYEEVREFQAGMGVTRYENNTGSPSGFRFAYAIVQLNPPDQPLIYDRIKKPKLP